MLCMLCMLCFEANRLILRRLANIRWVLCIDALSGKDHPINSVYKYTKNQRDKQIIVKIPKGNIS